MPWDFDDYDDPIESASGLLCCDICCEPILEGDKYYEVGDLIKCTPCMDVWLDGRTCWMPTNGLEDEV